MTYSQNSLGYFAVGVEVLHFQKKNGVGKAYSESGALQSEINFKNGKALSGVYYHKNGKIDRKMTNEDFSNLGYEH